MKEIEWRDILPKVRIVIIVFLMSMWVILASSQFVNPAPKNIEVEKKVSMDDEFNAEYVKWEENLSDRMGSILNSISPGESTVIKNNTSVLEEYTGEFLVANSTGESMTPVSVEYASPVDNRRIMMSIIFLFVLIIFGIWRSEFSETVITVQTSVMFVVSVVVMFP